MAPGAAGLSPSGGPYDSIERQEGQVENQDGGSSLHPLLMTAHLFQGDCPRHSGGRGKEEATQKTQNPVARPMPPSPMVGVLVHGSLSRAYPTTERSPDRSTDRARPTSRRQLMAG